MSSPRALVTLGSLLGSLTGPARGQGRDWMFGPFEKPPLGNPAIAPNGAATFFSPSLIGEKKVAAPFGAIAGFTSGGFSKGPNIQSRPCPRAGPVSEPSRDPSVTSALALLTRDRRATGQARSTSRGSYDYIAAPWHFLNFLPLPQGQGSLRPTPA